MNSTTKFEGKLSSSKGKEVEEQRKLKIDCVEMCVCE